MLNFGPRSVFRQGGGCQYRSLVYILGEISGREFSRKHVVQLWCTLLDVVEKTSTGGTIGRAWVRD